MAALLGLPMSTFRARHTELLPGSGGTLRLRTEPGTGRCSLLASDGRCSVHEARPAACRTYPFWPENLASPYEWAREASFCEGIGSPWNRAGAEMRPHVTGPEVDRELLLEELRATGSLAAEDWTHEDAAGHLDALREAGDDLVAEPQPPPRRVLLHRCGLIILDTPEDGSQGDEGWVLRSLHFESSVGVVQTEVRCHPGQGLFDYTALAFTVHRCFRALLISLSASIGDVGLAPGVAILGGGGGALPMALCVEGLAGGAMVGLGPVTVVERDATIVEAARSHFGFREGPLVKGGTVGVELFIRDAVDFIATPPPGAPHSFAAIFVDVADGTTLLETGLLAPPLEFFTAGFVRGAVAAVRAAGGVVAWNVLGSSEEESLAGVRFCAVAVADSVDGLGVSAFGPIRHDDGSVQWLLVASTVPRPIEGCTRFLEVEGLTCLSGEQLLA